MLYLVIRKVPEIEKKMLKKIIFLYLIYYEKYEEKNIIQFFFIFLNYCIFI